MTAAPSSFDTFLENIRLTRELRDACQEEQNELRRKLLADPTLNPIFVSMFLQGSYARKTGTKPHGSDSHVDVDLVVVTTLDPAFWTPAKVVDRFRPFLDREYPGQWSPNDRSLKISPVGSAVTLDLVVTAAPSEIQQEFFASFRESGVPTLIEARGERDDEQALDLREAIGRITKAYGGGWQRDPLLIPSRDLSIWVPTHPLEQIRWTSEKNARTNRHYVNVVKAIRWWRKGNPDGTYPKAYPLEHFIGDACPDDVSSVAEGVTRALEVIRDAYQPWQFTRGVPQLFDRGVPLNDVFRRITADQYRTFYDLAAAAAYAARGALDADTNAESVKRWHDLFGPEFPEPPSTSFTPPSEPAKATTRGRYG